MEWILSTIGPVAQRITRLTTDQKIAGSNPAWVAKFFPSFLGTEKCVWAKYFYAPPGGLEPPTFRLTAERASRLRHGGQVMRVASISVPQHAEHDSCTGYVGL